MIREKVKPFVNFQNEFENIGFNFHSIDGKYWNDGIAYRFTLAEIEKIEKATEELFSIVYNTCEDIVTRGDTERFGFNSDVAQMIENSWNLCEYGTYSRFDLAYDGTNIKMLEINADTPTCLIESSLAQHYWLLHQKNINGLAKHVDQFNFIHETLLEMFDEYKQSFGVSSIGFAVSAQDTSEDYDNAQYLAETALAAGIETSTNHIQLIEDIAINEYGGMYLQDGRFVDAVFKLYPWEWMIAENKEVASRFGRMTRPESLMLEPMFKLLMSNKGIMVRAWELYKNHPNLLPTFFADSSDGRNAISYGKWCKKPTLSREGANITKIDAGKPVDITGTDFYNEYDKDYIVQQWFDIPRHDGMMPMIGSWNIHGTPCGIGLREEQSDVTGNGSLFVPHYFI